MVAETEFLGELLALVKPDPSASLVVHLVAVYHAKETKQLFLIFFFDTEASVNDVKFNGVLFFDKDLAHRDFDTALESELHRVSDQVVENLNQSPRVRVEDFWDLFVNLVFEIDSADLGALGECVEEIGQDLADVCWLDIDGVFVFLVDVFGGVVEHVADQAHQKVAVDQGGFDILLDNDLGISLLTHDHRVK